MSLMNGRLKFESENRKLDKIKKRVYTKRRAKREQNIRAETARAVSARFRTEKK